MVLPVAKWGGLRAMVRHNKMDHNVMYGVQMGGTQCDMRGRRPACAYELMHVLMNLYACAYQSKPASGLRAPYEE